MGNTTFADRVRTERNKKGMSIDDLAKQLGLQKSRVAMWESAGAVPRRETLFSLCKFFGVSTDYLLGNGGEEKSFKDGKITSIERGLKQMSPEELENAEIILKTAFKNAFGGK